MKHEIFTDSHSKNIVVITEWGNKKQTANEAIRYAANYYFKCKRDKLQCINVYMKDKNADELYFFNAKGTKKYFGVCRKYLTK